MRIGLVQLAVNDGQVHDNLSRAEILIRKVVAIGDRPDVVLLPELWTTGYVHDRWERIAADETPKVAEQLRGLARELGVSIGGSMVTWRDEGGGLVNRFTIVTPDGTTVGVYDKAHLFSPMREKEFLIAGSSREHAQLPPPAGREKVVTAGMSICYDLRFPAMYRASAHEGVELFLVPSAWPEPRCAALRTLAMARAIENQAFLALCNRAGPAADGSTFCGGSMIVSPIGEILLDLGPDENIGVAEVRLRESAAARAMLRVLSDELEGIDRPAVSA